MQDSLHINCLIILTCSIILHLKFNRIIKIFNNLLNADKQPLMVHMQNIIYNKNTPFCDCQKYTSKLPLLDPQSLSHTGRLQYQPLNRLFSESVPQLVPMRKDHNKLCLLCQTDLIAVIAYSCVSHMALVIVAILIQTP